MNNFGFMEATMTVFYQTGTDDLNEPIIKSSTYRNVASNVTAAQLTAIATALVGLTDYQYLDTVKTTKEIAQ